MAEALDESRRPHQAQLSRGLMDRLLAVVNMDAASREKRSRRLPKIPDTTYGFGAGLTILVESETPAMASQTEIEDRPLVEAALAADPRPNGELPPLYRSSLPH